MIETVDTSRESVEKTGRAFLIVGAVLAGLWCWKYGFGSNGWRWVIGSGVLLFLAGRFAYEIMKPIHIGWMKFALGWGWVTTRIILTAFFYFFLTPVGLMMRLFGKDLLDEKIDPTTTTYWKKKTTTNDPQTMERQF